MRERTGLPEQVARSVDLLVESLNTLEVLLALHRASDRTWTADQVASLLRISARAARHELDRLGARGLVESREVGDGSIFRYRPLDRTLAAHVARIADAYATRRIEVINHVASGRLRRLRPGYL